MLLLHASNSGIFFKAWKRELNFPGNKNTAYICSGCFEQLGEVVKVTIFMSVSHITVAIT